ncbi:unnamed protein product, partial [Allacma fusca]
AFQNDLSTIQKSLQMTKDLVLKPWVPPNFSYSSQVKNNAQFQKLTHEEYKSFDLLWRFEVYLGRLLDQNPAAFFTVKSLLSIVKERPVDRLSLYLTVKEIPKTIPWQGIWSCLLMMKNGEEQFEKAEKSTKPPSSSQQESKQEKVRRGEEISTIHVWWLFLNNYFRVITMGLHSTPKCIAAVKDLTTSVVKINDVEIIKADLNAVTGKLNDVSNGIPTMFEPNKALKTIVNDDGTTNADGIKIKETKFRKRKTLDDDADETTIQENGNGRKRKSLEKDDGVDIGSA